MKNMVLSAVWIIASMVVGIANANALEIYCRPFKVFDKIERPANPSCASHSMDRTSFEFCRSAMETYQENVQNYLRCLREEANSVTDELNQEIDRFNCYARGGSFC